MAPPRVLLLMPKTTYRADAFLDAARRMGVEVRTGSDRCHVLAVRHGVPLALDFRDPAAAVRAIVEHAREEPFAAVVPTDDRSTVIAALAARALGLAANPPEAVYAARNKATARDRLAAAGVPSPAHRVLEADGALPDFAAAAAGLGYPVVVKPLLMSGSRGVMRADDRAGLARALDRLRRILRAPDVEPDQDRAAQRILIERFVPGAEVALEGMLRQGALEVLAVLDKPDPLDGPFFEERIYVTPSRLDGAALAAIAAAAARGASALGLVRGPVHAELRWDGRTATVIEIASRSIGGLCSRALRFTTGRTLEELILADALGAGAALPPREAAAAGVMMLPIRTPGILRAVSGVERALAVPGIEAVEITAPLGHELVPLPEGSSYLGFVFAGGTDPGTVEAALRRAESALAFTVTPNLARRASAAP